MQSYYPRLSDLFNKYGSDKDRNGYSPYYESLFHHIRHRKMKMLEIGIGTMIPGVHSSMVGYALDGYKPGGSLRAWRDYFTNGSIYGCDVQPDTQFSDVRIKTFLADSTNLNSVDAVLDNHQPNLTFDVILDDGSHWDEHQLITLRNLYFKRLNDGGYYIIEDIYPGSRICTEFLPHIKSIIGPYASYYFSEKKNICIILKPLQWTEEKTGNLVSPGE
jgi:demethylmacrocin O-methyltransferase